MNPLPFALTLGGIAFLLAVIWGDPLIELLRRLGIGQQQREDAPEWQRGKQGTPTMGGILILLPVMVVTLGVNFVNLIRPVESGSGISILLPLFALTSHAILGGWDDLKKLRTRGEGISSRTKLLWQIGLALITAIIISVVNGGFQYANEVFIPIVGVYLPITPIIYILGAAFTIVATANAVNFTDGLDGLAGTVTASAFVGYGLISYLQGQIFLVQFCFIMVGACFAFLWFNAVPAQLFMGDTGALALGATLATVALMTGQWLLLPIIAIIPVLEATSVLLQIWYARFNNGARLFKRSPLHFHFQLSGWSEMQVVQRFWLVSILSAMVGVALALIRPN